MDNVSKEGAKAVVNAVVSIAGAAVTVVHPELQVPIATAAQAIQGFFAIGIEQYASRGQEFTADIGASEEVRRAVAEGRVSQEQFVDIFVYGYEKYIRERSEAKRLIMKSIMRNAFSNDLDEFPLEKLYAVTETLSLFDIRVLRRVKEAEEVRDRKGINLANIAMSGRSQSEVSAEDRELMKVLLSDSGNTDEIRQGQLDLTGAGLLERKESAYLGGNHSEFRLSSLGRAFVHFLDQD
jgi:hypothetical protein